MWIAQESTIWRRSLWEKAGAKLSTGLKAAADFELWLRFFQYDTLYFVSNCIGMFRHRKGQISEQLEAYLSEVDEVYSKLKISDADQKIIDTYKQKKKIANWINKLRIINGNKIVRLRTFEKRYLSVPPTLVWSDDIEGYNFNENE